MRLQPFGVPGLLLAVIMLLALACTGEQQAERQEPKVVTVTKEVTREVAENETDSASKTNAATETTESDEGTTFEDESAEQQFISDYYEAVDNEDWANTYSMLDEASQAEFTEEEWFSVQQAREASFPIPSIESATLSNIRGEEAGFTTDVILTYEDGTQETTEDVVVYLEDGKFRRHLTEEETSYLRSLVGDDVSDSGEEAAIETTIKSHYEAIGEGDFEQAYSYFGPTFRNATEEEVWIEEEKSFDITSSTVHSVEVGEVLETTATATVDVSFEDNTGIPRFLITWNLVKENGEWKLDSQASAETLTSPEPAPQPEPPRDKTQDSFGKGVTVIEVVDGDTVEISPAVDGIEEVRLIGVDTPETVDPSEEVEPYGPQASEFTTSKLEGEEVELEFDQERIDQYDRLLAYVYLKGQDMFNETLLEEGYAQAYPYPPNTKYEDRFAAAQEEARDAGLGIWALPKRQQCKLADRGNGIGEGTPGCERRRPPRPAPEPERGPKPERTPRQEPRPGPEPGPDRAPSGGGNSVPPISESDCPRHHPVKGNQSGIYHDENSPYYDATNPEECFVTAADAEDAGYRPPEG